MKLKFFNEISKNKKNGSIRFVKKNMRQKLLLLIPVVILGIKQINAGCPLINVSLQDRINQSEIVVEAKVINKNPYFNSKENFIYTAQELVITRIFKGNITS